MYLYPDSNWCDHDMLTCSVNTCYTQYMAVFTEQMNSYNGPMRQMLIHLWAKRKPRFKEIN